VITDNYIFDMVVNRYDNHFMIAFGDPNSMDGPCVEIKYDLYDESVLKLCAVTFDERCSSRSNQSKPLEKGSGTQQMIVAAIVSSSFQKSENNYSQRCFIFRLW